MKKITSFLLVLALVMTLSVGVFAAETKAGDKVTVDGVEYIAIDDAAQITDLTANYYLIKDITWPEVNIGDFSGSFHGGNHTITVSGDSLFSVVGGPNSVISNFNVVGSEVMPTSTFGVIAPETNGGTFKNINVNASVLATAKYVGGFFGKVAANSTADFLVLENCVNYGLINGTERVAGILASVDGITTMKTVTMKNCVNHGDVITDSAYYAGGLFAVINGAQTEVTMNFENCVNNGNVSALNSFVGGIFGGIYKAGSNPTLNFKGCTNNGAVTTSTAGDTYGAGGIFGGADQSFVTITATDCVNNGVITSPRPAGGIIGGATQMTDPQGCNITVTNCANTGAIVSDNANGYFAAIVTVPNTRIPAASSLTVSDCYSTVADLQVVKAVELSGETTILTVTINKAEVVTDINALVATLTANTTGLTFKAVDGAIQIAVNGCTFENGVCKDCGAPDAYNPAKVEPPVELPPETTAAPNTTKKPAQTTAPSTTAPADKKDEGGCKGFAAGSVALISMITLAGAAVLSKKER